MGRGQRLRCAVAALAIVAALCPGPRPAAAQEPDWTKTLDPTNFEREVYKSGKHVLIRYCAPWSGSCKQMQDAWNLVCKEFYNSPNVLLADIDCDAHYGLCSKYGVYGYPMLKYFINGNKFGEVYRGGHYFEELYHLVKNTVDKKTPPRARYNTRH
eukprot:TRINITY_DN60456_c0_g1_i1.p1 TRINITY_DN60456_c0_g1~~TRINITY_DN60456_c0_g1_i1.p1  ORF type:complete len:156 (+),score=52.92 TRINITY_DN60456_c0_g1_i1:81-548(+)